MSGTEPLPIWTPTPAFAAASVIADYQRWLQRSRGLRFDSYEELWRWSVTDLTAFWQSIWDYFELQAVAPASAVLADARMPGARWFDGARLNYVQQVFRHARAGQPAIRFAGESAPLAEMSWAELQRQVASVAAALRQMGVQPGDRVAAYLPNIPQTVVAFLAAASIGATWSVCAPEMGPVAVLDRLRQIEPKVLFATPGYRYGGRQHDRSEVLRELLAGLPSVRHWVLVRQPGVASEPSIAGPTRHLWDDLLRDGAELRIEPLPFDHPLWVVYSSGTTGMPKPIVHGHGGIVVEHLKMLGLHCDLRAGDVYHWFSSSGWIMWNVQVGGLLLGSTIALVDGSPGWPDLGRLWRLVDEAGVTAFGAGAAFFANCMKAGIEPARIADLSRLKMVGSTGSPLAPEAYEWIGQHVRADVWINPVSGGTDFASAFVGGVPTLPVYAGEMQCRCLGAKVEAFDDAGRALVDEVGELVCTAPLPSMPLRFWGDADGRRLHESYFDVYPGVWRHGDWVRITPRGGVIIYGRSDATINRHGIRMGTSELYRLVEDEPEVLDSLVVDLEYLGRASWMTLFVVLRDGAALDEALVERLKRRIRAGLSPHHVPTEIVQAPDVPRTLSGKKMEVPIKKLMLGQELSKVANADAMANASCLPWYRDFAGRHLARQQER
ncbi:MAG: acetoacetate--CoA ligase [Burkholderiales bacterium]|nr:MAG: acetoacetate--CoA ligase [Burkholderiales bacterium]